MRAKEFIKFVNQGKTEEEKAERLATLTDSLVNHVERAAEKSYCNTHKAFASLLKEADEIRDRVFQEFHLKADKPFSIQYVEALSGKIDASHVVQILKYLKKG